MSLMIAALLAISAVTGCSKHSSSASQTQSSNVTDLGVVELSNGVTVRRDLPDGRTCVITPEVIPTGALKFIRMTMVIEKHDSSGAIQTQEFPVSKVIAGETMKWHDGDQVIKITTKLQE